MSLETIHQALTEFGAAHHRIEQERYAVDELLDSQTAPAVYGFNTLLGHHDNREATVGDQEHLLDAHLVGPVSSFPSSWGKLLTRVKLAQLSHGGSGVHPDTYKRLELFLTFPDDQVWEGNWTSSYSCGDVVPGTWFVHNLRQHGVDAPHHRGDLIALINGSFVSTAAGLIVAQRFCELTAAALALIESVSHRRGIRGVQKSVTMRDVSPLRNLVETANITLIDALTNRLVNPSANPIFTFGKHTVPHSQSSFLDFTLTTALTQAAQTCSAAAAYVKGAVTELVSHDTPGATARVQPVKIIEALIREMSAFPSPSHFGLTESNGVEDVADLSLLAARTLASLLTRLEQVFDIACDVCGDAPVADVDPFPECVNAAKEVLPLLAI